MSEHKGSWWFIFEVHDEVVGMKLTSFCIFMAYVTGIKTFVWLDNVRQFEYLFENIGKIIFRKTKHNYGTKASYGFFWLGT